MWGRGGPVQKNCGYYPQDHNERPNDRAARDFRLSSSLNKYVKRQLNIDEVLAFLKINLTHCKIKEIFSCLHMRNLCIHYRSASSAYFRLVGTKIFSLFRQLYRHT